MSAPTLQGRDIALRCPRPRNSGRNESKAPCEPHHGIKILLLLCGITVAPLAFDAAGADKKIVLIAGKPSHGPGEHEFRAGCLLLSKCLAQFPGISSMVYSNGWPQDESA